MYIDVSGVISIYVHIYIINSYIYKLIIYRFINSYRNISIQIYVNTYIPIILNSKTLIIYEASY